MKKSLMFLITVLLTAGLATAQSTAADKAPIDDLRSSKPGVVQADAHADPRGSDNYKAAQKSHNRGKKGHKGGKKGTRKTKPNLAGPI